MALRKVHALNEHSKPFAMKRSDTSSAGATLVWFRADLRLTDNPALDAAVKRGGAVVPVFIWSPEEEAPWQPGAASKWWLHQSLNELNVSLRRKNSRLIIRSGAALESLRALVKETGAKAVFWNRRYEPRIMARDAMVDEALRAESLAVESFNSGLLCEPWTIRNQSGKPFQVFTPFWRHCLNQPDPDEPLCAPESLPTPRRWPKSLALAELKLEPKIDWAGDIRAAWSPGESNALKSLKTFLADRFADYSDNRNRPDLAGTSKLSPHLHFGELSPRQVWHTLKRMAARKALPAARWRSSQFLTELGWREFAHHLIFHFPHTPTEPLRPAFKKFPWRNEPGWLRAWQGGRTGYPIVDAGMRELWATGWMHNRVRMIVASFLVKDLLLRVDSN